MSFFISDALAQAAEPAPGAGLAGLLPFLLLFVVFYFFLIRPQSKRVKEHKKMVEALAKDDEVVTNGGLMGRVTNVGDEFISLEIAEGIVIKVQKHFVSSHLPKGTVKSA